MTNPQHEALVEAVARAIYEEDDPWHKAWPWPDLNPEAQGGLASAERYRGIARAALSATAATPSDEVVRERYRHVKRGTVYEVIGTASLQIATGDLVDGSDLVIYRGEDGKLWARETSEFHDGRFAPETDVRKGSS